MKKILILLIVAFLASCSSTKVFMDYDKEAEFSSYQTYDYYLAEQTGLSLLDEKRVVEALDSLLPKQGYLQKSTPDFNVNFYAEIYTVNNQNSIGVGFGGGGGRVGGGVSGGIPINTSKDMIALTLEFIDAETKELFWQAVVETRLKANQNPIKRQEFFNEIIQKALEKYPPKRKRKK